MVSFARGALAGGFLAATIALGAMPIAAASGVAYGSVTKFSAGGGDASAPAPGSYRTDFTTASTPAQTGDAPHAPFGLGKMLAKAQSAMAMFANGTAERHYVGERKERIDNLAMQTADITDCTARTLTHLDLAKRTYSVTSLDQPQAPAAPESRHRSSQPGPTATDDGTKVAMVVTTRALGPMTIDGVATSGYATNIRMTATKPTGESASTNMTMTAYYSAMDEPHFSCSGFGMFAGPPAAAASMANYALAMRALRTSRGDARFTVSSSGPALPANKFAMWQTTSMMGDARGSHGGGFNMTVERGDVRAPISDGDPIFGIPAGFTKVDA